MRSGFCGSRSKGIGRWGMETFVALALVGGLAFGLGLAGCGGDDARRDTAQTSRTAVADAGAARSETPRRNVAVRPEARRAVETPASEAPAEAQEVTTAESEVTTAESEVATAEPEPLRPVTYQEAEEMYRAGQYADAADAFTVYAQQNSENPWGYYMLGLSQWKAGRNQDAYAALKTAQERDPQHAKTSINLARVLLELNRPEEAMEEARKGADLDPLGGAAHRVLARAYHAAGETELAITTYHRAVRIDHEDAWAMNNLGLVLIEEERFAEALPPLARAVQLRGDVAAFHNNLGIALERTERSVAAAEAYRAALAVDSTYAKAATSLARVEPLAVGPADSTELNDLAQQFADRISRPELSEVAP